MKNLSRYIPTKEWDLVIMEEDPTGEYVKLSDVEALFNSPDATFVYLSPDVQSLTHFKSPESLHQGDSFVCFKK
ncbi:MAG: hypothetical protein US20_C0026G0008 [Candidatus Pacebacteria bacterium GW2011_GWF1_36_5]|nr:MAG: hypothetical protein US20_C0026G0008 [Candidatus Pacebacteria bacterium GW2011_GWF1_36_5]